MPRILAPVEPRGPGEVITLPRPREVGAAPTGLADFGGALSETGNFLLRHAVQQERSAEQTRIATEAESRWGALRGEVESAGTAAEARSAWEKGAPKVRKELERFAQERGLPEAIPDLQLLAANNDAAVQSALVRRSGAEGVDAAKAYAFTKLESYVNASTGAEAQRHKADLHRELTRVAQTNPLFSPGEADALFEATVAEGGRRRLNTQVSRAVASRDIGTLRNLGASIDDLPDLTADTREAARATIDSSIRQVEAQMRADAHRAGAVAASNLYIGLFNATDPAEIDGILQETETLFAQGMIPPDTRVSLHRNGIAKRETLLEGVVEQADIMARLSSGFGLNSQREADIAYSAEAAQIPPERTFEHLVDFTERSGVPPAQAANMLERAERMDQPDQLALAAKFVGQLQDRAPAAASRLNVGTRVESAAAYVKTLGMTPEEAARLVIDQTPDAPVLKDREERFDAEFEDFEPLAFLQSHDIAPTFWFSADTEVRDRILVETEDTMRRVWRMTGSKEAAEAAAANALRRRFSVTQVGGRMRLTDTPPEPFGQMAFKGNIEADVVARAVDSEIERFLGEAGIELPEPPPGLEDQPQWELLADEQTQQEKQAGQQPSWQLWVRGDEFGNMRRISDGRGGYIRYRMPNYEELREIGPVRERIQESFREGLGRQTGDAESEVHRLERERLLLVPQAAAGIAGAREKLQGVEAELGEAKRRLEDAQTRLGP